MLFFNGAFIPLVERLLIHIVFVLYLNFDLCYLFEEIGNCWFFREMSLQQAMKDYLLRA